MLTLDQALTKLAELTAPGKSYSTQQLLNLASQVTLDAAPGSTQGRVTLLYSGQINGVSSTDFVKQIIADGADIRVIDKTQAGQFLANSDFRKAWLKHSTREIGVRLQLFCWAMGCGITGPSQMGLCWSRAAVRRAGIW